MLMAKKEKRKKTNFMVNEDLLVEIKQYIPDGERSDFVNEALEGAIELFRRKKAVEEMDRIRNEDPVKITTEEFIRLKNYGRE